MHNAIMSVRDALKQENWHGALFVVLALPDIFAALEHGKTSAVRYSTWFEANLPEYKGFLSGNDCYALRCALLHEGKDDITDQKKKEVIDRCIFISGSSAHCNLVDRCRINGVSESFLQLNVKKFCEDICSASETWLENHSANKVTQARLANTIKIHNPGYTYKGVIRFD